MFQKKAVGGGPTQKVVDGVDKALADEEEEEEYEEEDPDTHFKRKWKASSSRGSQRKKQVVRKPPRHVREALSTWGRRIGRLSYLRSSGYYLTSSRRDS